MRWKFIFDETDEEAEERSRIRRAIADWWKEFESRTEDLGALFSQKQEWDLPAWMHQHLNAISPHLMWEFGPGILGGHRLVITPECERALRPLVIEVLAAAPKIAGWEFYGYRLAESFEIAEMTVDGRGGGRLAEMRFVLSPGDFNRIDVRCCVGKDYPEDLMRPTGFVAIETLLGEELLDRWIGGIDYERADPFPPEACHGRDLLARARNVVDGLTHALPSAPWIGRAEECSWTAFKLEPKKADEYPGRKDQFTQISACPELHQCFFSGAPLDSTRFSRCDEVFAFVKVDGSEKLPDWGFKDRSEVEDALIASLEAAGLGTVIGGGMGLRYSYVDLALLDVQKAVPAIREALIRGGIPVRSWLLFFDRDYADEWVGIHSETPPPPRAIPDPT